MKIQRLVLVAFLGCVATAVQAQQAQPGAPAQQLASVPALNGPTVLPDYKIGTQDTITIEVFGVPELSQTAVQVDNAGTIAMPLIGRISAVGLTTGELSQKISHELDQKFVKNPIVTVAVKDAASQKITVDGSVTQPGVYEIPAHTTLTQAVSLAKGPDNVANIHTVSIVRNGASGRTVSTYDLDAIHDGKTADPVVEANDEIVVDTSGSRKFVRDFGSVLGLLSFWHP